MGSWKKAMGAVVAAVALVLGAGFAAAAAGDDAGAGAVQAAQGMVKWFNAEKGFGFVGPAQAELDVALAAQI